MKNKYLLGVCETKPKMIGTLLVPIGLLTTLVGWFVSNITESWVSPKKLGEMLEEDNKNDNDTKSK